MCLTWMLLCLFLRQSATQNPAPEGGKLPQTDEDTIDPVESIFIVITGKRARNRLGAMTERIQLKKKVAINEIKLNICIYRTNIHFIIILCLSKNFPQRASSQSLHNFVSS